MLPAKHRKYYEQAYGTNERVYAKYDSTCRKTQSEEPVRTGIKLLDPVPDVFGGPFADMVIVL